MLILALLSCSDRAELSTSAPETVSDAGRLLTPELWAGTATSSQQFFLENGQFTIRGLIEVRHPVGGRPINIYERIERLEQGRKRQLLAITQDRTGLGRVLEQRSDLPDRRFTGDVVFPLGIWVQGEAREFKATEFTMFGPALRLITLKIVEIDYVYDGVAHSFSYRRAIRDEANRVLNCEVSVYSPGRGLVAFMASSYWRSGTGCTTCPCAGD